MKNAAQRQFETAVEALKSADKALEHALNYPADPEDNAAHWAQVRALQAQAQLHVLHSISHDLDGIRTAVETT